MASTRSIPWPRILAEGFAIVVSILLAFGIQAWWEGRQESEALRQDLVNVAEELASNRERVVWEEDYMRRLANGSAGMARMMSATAGDVVSVPDTLAYLASTTGSTLDVSVGALDGLVASGRLSQIADPNLRSGLAGLRALIEDATELQEIYGDLARSHLYPLLDDADVDRELASEVGRSFWLDERVIGKRLVGEGQVDFPNSAAIRNHLRDRSLSFDLTALELRDLQGEIDRLLTMLNDLT